MKAQNLTISIPCDECNKKCHYCISRITWKTKSNLDLMIRNILKVKRVAKIAGVTNVLFTSKKEPFMNSYELFKFICDFSEDHWIEVQTNGIKLKEEPKELSQELYNCGADVIAFSVDNMKELKSLSKAIEYLNSFDLVVRLCFNITRFISDSWDFDGIMKKAKELDVKQVLFRNINYPSNANPNLPEVLWIERNVTQEGYISLYKQMIKKGLEKIRVIPQTGVVTYSYDDISVCFSDYCVQETNTNDNLRSLIFQEDGHVYTSWNHRSSILF